MSKKFDLGPILKISIVAIHPEFIEQYLKFGVIKGAIEHGFLQIKVINLRDFSLDVHRSVDDKPYGGGDSMVLSPEPLARCINSLESAQRVVYTAPGQKMWDHIELKHCLSVLGIDCENASLGFQNCETQNPQHWVFICGRFGGIDQRFIDKYVTHQYSFCDVVLSGGELPVLAIIDSIIRFFPGSMNNIQSAINDSFSHSLNGMIEYPVYTRPVSFEGSSVPDVLLSGNHEKIIQWRKDNLRKPFAKK